MSGSSLCDEDEHDVGVAASASAAGRPPRRAASHDEESAVRSPRDPGPRGYGKKKKRGRKGRSGDEISGGSGMARVGSRESLPQGSVPRPDPSGREYGAPAPPHGAGTEKTSSLSSSSTGSRRRRKEREFNRSHGKGMRNASGEDPPLVGIMEVGGQDFVQEKLGDKSDPAAGGIPGGGPGPMTAAAIRPSDKVSLSTSADRSHATAATSASATYDSARSGGSGDHPGPAPRAPARPRAVLHACDERGRCLFHPDVVLRKKMLLGGWKDVLAACPVCEREEEAMDGGSPQSSAQAAQLQQQQQQQLQQAQQQAQQQQIEREIERQMQEEMGESGGGWRRRRDRSIERLRPRGLSRERLTKAVREKIMNKVMFAGQGSGVGSSASTDAGGNADFDGSARSAPRAVRKMSTGTSRSSAASESDSESDSSSSSSSWNSAGPASDLEGPASDDGSPGRLPQFARERKKKDRQLFSRSLPAGQASPDLSDFAPRRGRKDRGDGSRGPLGKARKGARKMARNWAEPPRDDDYLGQYLGGSSSVSRQRGGGGGGGGLSHRERLHADLHSSDRLDDRRDRLYGRAFERKATSHGSSGNNLNRAAMRRGGGGGRSAGNNPRTNPRGTRNQRPAPGDDASHPPPPRFPVAPAGEAPEGSSYERTADVGVQGKRLMKGVSKGLGGLVKKGRKAGRRTLKQVRESAAAVGADRRPGRRSSDDGSSGTRRARDPDGDYNSDDYDDVSSGGSSYLDDDLDDDYFDGPTRDGDIKDRSARDDYFSGGGGLDGSYVRRNKGRAGGSGGTGGGSKLDGSGTNRNAGKLDGSWTNRSGGTGRKEKKERRRDRSLERRSSLEKSDRSAGLEWSDRSGVGRKEKKERRRDRDRDRSLEKRDRSLERMLSLEKSDRSAGAGGLDRSSSDRRDRSLERSDRSGIGRSRRDKSLERMDRSLERKKDRSLEQRRDRSLERRPSPEKRPERRKSRSLERRADRSLERRADRSLEKRPDRSLERRADRSLERRPDRSLERRPDRGPSLERMRSPRDPSSRGSFDSPSPSKAASRKSSSTTEGGSNPPSRTASRDYDAASSDGPAAGAPAPSPSPPTVPAINPITGLPANPAPAFDPPTKDPITADVSFQWDRVPMPDDGPPPDGPSAGGTRGVPANRRSSQDTAESSFNESTYSEDTQMRELRAVAYQWDRMPLPTSVEGASEGTAESDAVRMSRRRSSIDEGALSRQTSNSRLLDGDPDYSARTMRRRSSVDDGTMSGSQRSLVTGNDGGTSPNPLHDSTVTTAADALRMARLVGFSESSLVESTETLLPPTGGGGSPWRPAGNPPDRRPNAARRRSDESEMSTMTRPPPPSQPRRQSDGAPVQRRRSSVDEGAISRQNSRSRLLDGDDGQPSRTARRRSSVADDGSLSREGSRRNLMQGLDGGDDSDQSLLVMRRVVAEARRRRASEDGGDGEEEEDRSPSPTSDPPGDADQAGLLSMEDLLQSIQDDIRPKDESAAGNPAAPRAPPTRGEYLSDRIAQIKQTMQSEYRGSVQSEHTSYSGYSEIDDEESSVTDNGSDGRGGGADADSPRRDRASTDADETTGSAPGGDELDVSQRDESVATDAPEGIAAEEDDEDEGKDAEDEEEVEPAAEPGEDEAEDESPPPPPAPPAEKVKLSFGSGLNIDLSAITTLKAAKPSSRKSDPKPEDVPKPSRREEAKKVDPKTTIADIKTFETTNLPFTGSLGESGMYTGSVSGQYKPHGKGTMVYDNGDVIKGYWAEGDLVRESEMYSDSDDDEDEDDDDGEEDLMGSMANVATRSRSKSRDAGRSRSRDRRPAEAPPPPKPRTPSPPPPEFKIGDRGERKDMIVDKDEALKMIDHLQFGDGAFIRRSDGKWTYAVVKSFEDTQEGRNAIRFIVNDRNSSKSYAKKYWESHVRPLKGMKIPEPEKPAAAERGREKQRDGQAGAPSHDPAAADDRGTSCPPVTQSRFNFEVPGRRGRSRSHSKRRAVSASPMRILTSIVESEAEDEDDDDDGHTGSESTMQ